MAVKIQPVGRDDVGEMIGPDRFFTEVTYFMTPGDQAGIPVLGKDEYWIDLKEAQGWLDEGCIMLVSPLDAASKAEIELSEFQEEWLEWMLQNSISQIRIVR